MSASAFPVKNWTLEESRTLFVRLQIATNLTSKERTQQELDLQREKEAPVVKRRMSFGLQLSRFFSDNRLSTPSTSVLISLEEREVEWEIVSV